MKNITVVLPAGRLPLDIMQAASQLAQKHKLEVYLSNAQNLRLTQVPEDAEALIREELAALGATFKRPGTFSLPKVCIGKPHCNLALIDPNELSARIIESLSGRTQFKGKVKTAISACGMCCSHARMSDIGIVAKRDGFDLYAGGKGGSSPKVGRRIGSQLDEETVLDMVVQLIDYHDSKTIKKQRMFKLLDDSFPFPEV